MGRPVQFWINRQTGNVNSTTATLNGAISSTDTTITVNNVQELPTSGFINIDSETIAYQNVSGNQLLNCFRGQNNTTADAHVASTKVYLNNLPCVNVWPAPNQDNFYTFVYWRMRRIQDAGDGVHTQDIPFRMLPAMVAGLAYYMALKIPDALPRVEMLKAIYDEQWQLAADEDREKAPLRLAPRQMFF